MKLFFGGAEIPGHRTMLAEAGVEHVAMSYVGLRRRTKLTKPWVVAEKFPDHQSVFLDSGAYTLNKAEDDETYSQGELHDLAAAYMAFVHSNVDRVAMVSEFDSLSLGRDWIEAMREDFWDDIDDDKFLPIWHQECGLDNLDSLAQRYARVGVPQTALGERNLAPLLNSLVQRYGTRLHGIAMTKPDAMAEIRWDSVASTSWLSPSQYGDTIVWTGRELKRYPKKYKEQARKRHRTLFESAGFDAEKIEIDDTQELLRFTIWSWQQMAASVGRNVATTVPETAPDDSQETGTELVVTQDAEARNSIATVQERDDAERVNLPVLGLTSKRETYTDDEGVTRERDVDLVQVRSRSMRVCDTCFLAKKCPAFKPKTTCAYDIPVTVKNRDQVRALSEGLIEMQAQRVMFLKMAEDLEGGYADPNLSKEIDRLMALIDKKQALESEGFSLKIEAKERGRAGMISSLFGREAGEKMRALEAPIDGNSAIAEMGILEGELVDLPRVES